jgi:hypothetical protein
LGLGAILILDNFQLKRKFCYCHFKHHLVILSLITYQLVSWAVYDMVQS